MSQQVLNYIIHEPVELNLSYMPFIDHGGLFIPTTENYALGDRVVVDLLLPGKKESLRIEGKVIWITPPNALHHVLPGIGVQFIGQDAATVCSQIEASLDKKLDIGGYTYGITESSSEDRV